jgi:hypothetical protein
MHAVASSHLKKAGVFMSISVEVVGIHVFLVKMWWEHGRCFENVKQDAIISKFW